MALQAAVRCRSRLLRHLTGVARAFSDAPGAVEGGPQEPPLVFARKRGSKELRYYVLKDQASSALAVLQSAAYGTPLAGPSGAPRALRGAPPPSVCNSMLVQAAKDASLASKSAEIAEALALQGTPLEPSTLKALIASLGRADALGEALPLLDAWLQQQEEALEEDAATHAPLQVMTLLMDSATRAENTQLVLQVLARMARIGVTPQPQSLTTLLQCFMRLGQVQVAHSVLDWMRRNNLEPNIYSYTALLALPRHLGEGAAPRLLEQARAAYDKMRQDGVQPNARFFTEYLRICGRAGSLEAAEAAWADVAAAGVEPDLILYTAMIDACSKCGAADAALRVFREMRASGLQPDVVTYTSALTALQGAPNAAATARELWAGMAADGVRPNGMAIAAYLEILLLAGEIDEALLALAAAQPGGGARGRAPAPPGRTGWGRKMRDEVAASGLLDDAGVAYAVPTARGGPAAVVAAPRAGAGAAARAEERQRAPAAAGAAAEGAAGAGEEEEEGAVDLPRLYEHFMFAMAHKGQHLVVEQMARHMRARGLPHTLGTAAALLTAQALQHGHDTAKWLLQPPGLHAAAGSGGRAGSGSSSGAAALQLPDAAVESCLLGRGSPHDCAQRLMQQTSDGGGGGGARAGGRPSTAVANVVLAGLAARGHTDDAFQLYDWMKQQQADAEARVAAAAARAGQAEAPVVRGAQGGRGAGGAGRPAAVAVARAPCAPDAWTLQLLLYAALNAPKERQLELALRAMQEAREHGAAAGRRGRFQLDRRTRNAVSSVMRQSEAAHALLGAAAAADETADEHEERLRRLRGLLG